MRRLVNQRRAGGWTLLELLLAGVLLAVALLAAGRLFVRARVDVREGGRRSHAAAAAHERLEAHPPAGGPALEFFSRDRGRWQAVAPRPPDRTLWLRETREALFSLEVLADGSLDRDDPEASPADEPRLLLARTRVVVSRPGAGRPAAVLEALTWVVR